jgi:hypothetical protein
MYFVLNVFVNVMIIVVESVQNVMLHLVQMIIIVFIWNKNLIFLYLKVDKGNLKIIEKIFFPKFFDIFSNLFFSSEIFVFFSF